MDHKAYNLARYHARRKEFLEILGNKCVECGSTNELEFDHIDASTKSFEIGRMLNVSKARALEELAKCQILCKAHHKEKTEREADNKQVAHGGGLTGKRNCYCDLCAPLKRAYRRQYK